MGRNLGSLRCCPFLLLLLACSTTPETMPVGIEIRAVEAEAGKAVVADYVVAAPFERARAVLLDFDRHASFRPGMLETAVVEDRDNSGTIRFRMKGLLGMNPEVTCRLAVEEREGWLRLDYEMTEGDTGVSGVSGRFTLKALDEGRTLIRQESRIDAILLSEGKFLNDIRLDAEAIRAEMERSVD